MVNFTNSQRNGRQTTLIGHLTSVKMAIIKKTNNKKTMAGMWTKWNSYILLVGI